MIRIWVLFISVLVFAWHAYQDWRVDKYLVMGGPHLATAQLDDWLKQRQHVSRHQLKQWFLAQPWVKDVQFEAIDTEVLLIKPIESKPIARWRYGGLVSEEGRLMFVAGQDYDATLPKLEVNEPDLPQAVAFVQALLPVLKVHKSIFNVAQIRVKREQTGDWLVMLNDKHQLLFGTILLEKRIQVAQFVLNRLLEHGEAWGKIDLRYLNGFAISKNSHV
jgi:hypothetical protein